MVSQTIPQMMKRQENIVLRPVPTADLDGKVVIVTGANIGFGYETVRHFARMNPGKLILACRDEKKGADALDSIKNETGCKTMEVWLLDQSSFASVKKFANRAINELSRLDIFVENAAVILATLEDYCLTEDGFETMIQVNNLAPELLALLLLPLMLDTASKHPETEPVLSVVSSDVHHTVTFDKNTPNILSDFGSKEYRESVGFSPSGVYSKCKLLNVFFAQELHKRLTAFKAPAPIVVDSVSPAFSATGLVRHAKGQVRDTVVQMHARYGIPAEVGGRVIVQSVLDKSLGDLRGQYVSLGEIFDLSDFAVSSDGKEVQSKVWDETIAILQGVDERVQEICDKYLSRV